MENDPIDKTDFWKERIEDAESRGLLHRSVYIVNPTHWRDIADIHRKICDEIIPKGADVLDAGCGYGRASTWFDNYTGVDFSPDFLERAEERYPNDLFIQADLTQLPFEDNHFDWAICISIKAMVIGRKGKEMWVEMERELKRVAKKVLVLEYVNPETYEII